MTDEAIDLDELERLEREAQLSPGQRARLRGLRISAKKTKHGHSPRGGYSPEYSTWMGIIKRCTNPRARGYARYGGSGITVCERWRTSFLAFLADMGTKPSHAHTIDRIDNHGNYEPNNCRWATSAQQMRNTRATRMLTHNGETLTFAEWARRIGVSPATITRRVQEGRPVASVLAPGKRAYMRKKRAA